MGGGACPPGPPTSVPTALLQYNMLEILFSYCRKGSSFICQSVKRISQFNLLLLLSGFIQKSKTYRAGGTRGARLARFALNAKLLFHNACTTIGPPKRFELPPHIRRFQEYFNHINILISSSTLQFLQFWYQNGVNYLFW